MMAFKAKASCDIRRFMLESGRDPKTVKMRKRVTHDNDTTNKKRKQMNMSEFVTPLKESSSAHADMTPKHIILKRQRHLYDACTADGTEELRERKKLNRGITLKENKKRKFDVNICLAHVEKERT